MGLGVPLSCVSMEYLKTRRSGGRTLLHGGSARGWVLAAILVTIAQNPAHADLRPELQRALAAVPHARTQTGACVVDLSTGRTVFEHAADTPFVPASTMKIFAMAAALQELGADFQFETVLATDGIHLYVVGDGDPAFGDPRLADRRHEPIDAVFHAWAKRLRETGTTNIPGNLLLDTSVFDRELLHPSWEASDLGKWFAAPIGALNFNDNCVDITLAPRAAGAPALVDVRPRASIIRITNKTQSGGSGDPVLRHTPLTYDYTVSGPCPKEWPFGPASFPKPALLFAEAMRASFSGEGVTFSGTIDRAVVRRPDGTLAPELVVLATHRTPLSNVLNRIGKNSQNLFADALLKRAGYAWSRRKGQAKPVGSWAHGANAVEAVMAKTGASPAGFKLADGSGLSRDNRCTARQQTALLAWMYRQKWFDEFRENLTIAGVDGSLHKRLRDHPNRVFAKTGTMRSVRALTGYVTDAHGPRFAFSIIFNGYPGPSTPYREIQDQFCIALIREADEK